MKASVMLVVAAYLVFGAAVLNVPSVRSDELWETSRAYYLKNHGHPGEPLLPKEIAPFFATIQELGWKSWFIGSLKSATSALLMTVLPVNPLHANRLNGFLWSVSVCFFTYLLARKFGLEKKFAWIAVAVLIALPEFFQQVHFERSEMLICSLFLLGWLMLARSLTATSEKAKRRWLLITGVYAWLPSLLVHASGIVIPITLGAIYLLHERKKIRSIHTLLLGSGLAAGMLFFLYISGSMSEYARSMGGTDFFDRHACPPVICGGWRYVVTLPAVFYNKFAKASAWNQPVSALAYVAAAVFLICSAWKQRKAADEKNIGLLVSIVLPLLVLLLLSGSYGNYNVVVAPFVAIALTRGPVRKFLAAENSKRAPAAWLFPVLLLAVFCTNAAGMNDQYASSRELENVNSELRRTIPAGAHVSGMALYYLPFRDQPFYSVTWMEPSVGKSGLTFEKVVQMEKIEYVIADDAFASRANYRGREWADSLVRFLESDAELIRQIDTKFYLKIVPDSSAVPEFFRYRGFAKNYVQRIRIFKIISKATK